jgi:hypothetical protein
MHAATHCRRIILRPSLQVTSLLIGQPLAVRGRRGAARGRAGAGFGSAPDWQEPRSRAALRIAPSHLCAHIDRVERTCLRGHERNAGSFLGQCGASGQRRDKKARLCRPIVRDATLPCRRRERSRGQCASGWVVAGWQHSAKSSVAAVTLAMRPPPGGNNFKRG